MIITAKITYRRERKGKPWIYAILFLLSLVFLALARFLPQELTAKQKAEMLQAAEIMSETLSVIKRCSVERGVEIVEDTDINGTGLIGSEFSLMTTSVGSLEAKRTTVNPNMAALVVFLLRRAGVKENGAVAIGGSGSFPALILASLSAAKAINIRPLLICSLGASQWGANRLEFHFLDMLECLREAGVLDVRPVAASLGGERDIGEGMPLGIRAQLIKDIEGRGVFFIHEPELRSNVQRKMLLYEKEAGEKGIRCFINIGGNWSNMGTDAEVLNLEPGLAVLRKIPPLDKRGLIFEMAVRDIPVIHLLYIKGLVERFGLPWDPSPLPKPGAGSIYDKPVEGHPLFIALGSIYLLVSVLLIILYTRSKRTG